MARKVLTNAEMQIIINNGGSVLINCKTHTVLATTIAQLPDDAEILECFPLVPTPVFDEDDLNANAIGILGHFFSGTPANGDSIKFNSTTNVWEFSPLGGVGTTAVTSGGTGLTNIPANSVLYAGSLNTFSATTLGSTLEVVSNFLNVKTDSSVQKTEFALAGNLSATRKRINFIQGSNVTLNITDDPTNNKVDVTLSASSSAGSRWDQLANPTGNLSLSMGSSNTVFTWGNLTAANSLLQLKDSNNNTGNGYILDLVSGNSSTINLLRATVSGTSNGILLDNTGKLSILGSGTIEASTLRNLSSNGIVVRATGNSFISRSIVTSNPDIIITNADGVSGNVGLALSGSVVTGTSSATNVVGNISSNILALSWSGTLSKGQQNSSTVYNDQINTYVAGNKQMFSPNSVNAGLNVGSVAGNPSSLNNGDMWLNGNTGKLQVYERGTLLDLVQLTKGRKTLINSSAVGIFEVALSTLTACAMILNYAIYATDGTNIQVRSGSLRFSAVNKAGTIVPEKFIDTEGIAPSIGTLNVDWQVVAGSNKITITANAASSILPNTFYVQYSVDNLSDQIITIL